MAHPGGWAELCQRMIEAVEAKSGAYSWAYSVVPAEDDETHKGLWGNFTLDTGRESGTVSGVVSINIASAGRLDVSVDGSLAEALEANPDQRVGLLRIAQRDLLILVHELIHSLGPADADAMVSAYTSTYEWTFGRVLTEGTAEVIAERWLPGLIKVCELDEIATELGSLDAHAIVYPAETAAMTPIWAAIAELNGDGLDATLVAATRGGSRPSALVAALDDIARRRQLRFGAGEQLLAAVAGPLTEVEAALTEGTVAKADRAAFGASKGAEAAARLRALVRDLGPPQREFAA